MILVTGFLAKEKTTNASEVLVRSLIDHMPVELRALSNGIHFELMVDDAFSLGSNLKRVINEIKPKDCIFVGQAPGRNNITLERIATNYKFTGPPLGIGKPPQGEAISPDSLAAYMATLPKLEDAIERLHQAGIPAAISNDAGNSRCNQILYEGLQLSSSTNSDVRCGLVHIPALPEQVITQWPQHPSMTLDMARLAISNIILHVYENRA